MNNKYTKYIPKNNNHRIAGIFFIFSSFVYLYWLWGNLNLEIWWLSLTFFIAQAYISFMVLLSVINNWNSRYSTKRPDLPNKPPDVGVIVPTHGESYKILKRTIKSILHISYPGKVVLLISNDNKDQEQVEMLENLFIEIQRYNHNLNDERKYKRIVHLTHTIKNNNYKAGNLNQAVSFFNKNYPSIDLVLTQDADEIAYPEILSATVGYFNKPTVAYVQTIKQAKVVKEDPFGNHDLMWYCRTAASRDADNAMFACGSGVVWKISAVKSVGGFDTWNLVEDLTTSYKLLCAGWDSHYHYEGLSEGVAPEDLANFIKQRGTWAIDSLRLFFWDNPMFKKNLSLMQKFQFIETPLFYLNGLFTSLLVLVVSISLFFQIWPITADATTHALYLIPSFLLMEIYFILLAGSIPYRRVRQFWVGLSPVFIKSAFIALIYGKNKKPRYKVTRKENLYDNYLNLVIPQVLLLSMLIISLFKTIIATPLYSGFDWAVFFWGIYQASFFIQIIKVSFWKWSPQISFSFSVRKILSRYINKLGITTRHSDIQTVNTT